MSKIQLYSLPTPNGMKIGVALEEMGIPYDAHRVDIRAGVQHEDWFRKISPNGKIPAIVDPDGPGGEHAMMESGAILLHLANKSGMFLSEDPVERSETIQWLFFQVGHIGPMFGQLGHFYLFAKDACDHPYPVERYTTETKSLLGVLEKRLDGRTFLVGEAYSIADMATFPWVVPLGRLDETDNLLELNKYTNVNSWIGRILERPKTQAGMEVCAGS